MPSVEPRSDKNAERLLLTLMAFALLLAMSALGVLYLTLWARAAEDLTRLLPASTRSYAAAPAPWAALTRTLAMPIWADRAVLEAQVLRDGYLAGERAGEIAGLPIERVRELLRNMESVAVALVPTTDGDTILVFVELRDATERKRVLTRLAPLLETVDRRVGFRIDELRRRPWQTLIGVDIARPRIVDMEPWIIIAWGSPIGLEDLLEARVEGRRDALFRRVGFAPSSRNKDELRLAVDASSAWRLFATTPEPPGGLVEYLDLLTFAAYSEAGNDMMTLRAEITDRELAHALSAGLHKARHSLVELAPSDALFVVSATGQDLPALVEVVRGLAFRVQRDFEPSAETQGAIATLVAAAADLPPGEGEIALIGLASEVDPTVPSFLVLVRSSTPEALADILANSIPAQFGAGFAHGEVMHRGERLHLEVPHPVDDPPQPVVDVGLAWRVRQGLLEIAPSVAMLDRFADAPRRLRDTPRLAAARRGLPEESAVFWIGDRRLLAQSQVPLLGLLADRLREDFTFGMTLDALEDHLALRSNLGLWTLATAVASGSRKEIDSFALPDLEPRCRQAYDAFCTLYPDAVPCRPFMLGRRARLSAVCAALFERP